MGRFSFRVALAVGVLAAATPAMAQDKAPVVLSPSSEWAMEYADDSCRLARMFGTGENQTILYFERFEPGDPFTLLVGGTALNDIPADAGRITERG